jgi:hypothetical protein
MPVKPRQFATQQGGGVLNQIFKPLHARTADIDLAFAVDHLLRERLPDGCGVLVCRCSFQGDYLTRRL